MALGALVGAIGGGGTVGKAVVELIGDSSKLQSDLNKAKATTAGATTQMGAKTSKFSALSVGAYAAVGTAVIGFVGTTIKAASDLGEQMNRVRVVFGEAAGSVIKFSETSASALGLAQSEALEGAASFGALFDSAGLVEQASAKMSTQLLTLAADMASFNNQDPSEMLIRLRAGLSGEAEPLRRFGVFIDEARVKTEAYASGIAKAGEELTIGQKVQARFNVIMQDTAKQQGDFARTVGESLPNQLRVLRASFIDLAAGIGAVVLPTLTTLLKVVVSLLPAVKPLTIALVSLAGAFILLKGAALAATALVAVGAALQGFSILVGLGAVVGNFGIALSGLAAGPLAVVAASLVSLYLIVTNFKAAFEGVGQSIADALPPEYIAALTGAALGTTDLTGKTKELGTAQEVTAQSARDLLAAELALAGGFVGIAAAIDSAKDAELTLATARAELAKLTKEGKTKGDEYKAALEAVDDAARGSVQSQLSLAGAVQKFAEEAAETGDVQGAIDRVKDFGKKAGLTAGEISTLVGQVKAAIRFWGEVPDSKKTTYTTPGLTDSVNRVQALKNKLDAIPSTVTTRFIISGDEINPRGGAAGGIIAGQAGFITRGPTMLVGESRRSTFAGRGAEAVIPFDNRGIGILAKALEKAGGGTAAPVTSEAGNYLAIHFNAPIYGMRDFKRQVVRALEEASSRFAGR
jgi:hypothetical protein